LSEIGFEISVSILTFWNHFGKSFWYHWLISISTDYIDINGLYQYNRWYRYTVGCHGTTVHAKRHVFRENVVIKARISGVIT
jgi:hypothetical protein